MLLTKQKESFEKKIVKIIYQKINSEPQHLMNSSHNKISFFWQSSKNFQIIALQMWVVHFLVLFYYTYIVIWLYLILSFPS